MISINKEEDTKRLLLTHIDLDGMGAKVVMLMHQVPHQETVFADYKDFESEKDVFDYSVYTSQVWDEIWFTDFSPDSKSLEIFIKNNMRVIIIDHHLSRFEELNEWAVKYPDLITYYFDNTKSGTLLTHEFLLKHYRKVRFKKGFLEVINRVNNYDLFKDEDPMAWQKAKSLHFIMYSSMSWAEKRGTLGHYLMFLRKLVAYSKLDKFELSLNDQRIVVDKEAKEIKITNQILTGKLLIRKDERKKKFGIFKCKTMVGLVARNVLRKRTDLEYTYIINAYDPKDLRLSGRAPKATDFSLLTLEYAQGHEKACGFKALPDDFIPKFLSNKIKYIPYKKEEKSTNEEKTDIKKEKE